MLFRSLLTDFFDQAVFFYQTPVTYDDASVKPKWDEVKQDFFAALISGHNLIANWDINSIETAFKNLAAEKDIKVGELQMILRVMLVGSKTGPGVFVIAEAIGKVETIKRIEKAVVNFSQF